MPKLSFITCLIAFFVASNSYGQSEEDRCKQWRKQLEIVSNIDLKIDLSRQMVSEVDDPKCQLSIYTAVGNWFASKNHDSSIFYFDKAIALGEVLKEKALLVRPYSLKAFLLAEKGYEDEVSELLGKARNILGKYPESEYWTDYYAGMAKLADQESNYDQAITFVDSAIACNERLDVNEPNLSLYHNKGVYYLRMSNYENAVKTLLYALDLKEKHEYSNSSISNTIYILGVCYARLEQYEKANKNFKKCISMSRKSGNDYILTTSYIRLGQCLQLLGEPSQALIAIDSAILLSEKINNDYQLAEALKEKAYVYFENLKQLDQAELYFLKALEAAKISNVDLHVVSSLEGMIEFYLYKESYKKAKGYLEAYDEVTSRLGIGIAIQNLHELYHQYYQGTGQPIKALEHYKRYVTWKDSIASQEIKTKVADLEKKYDTKKKELEIVQLNKDREEQEKLMFLAESKQKFYLLTAVFLLLMLGISIWSFLKLRKQKRQLTTAHDELTSLNQIKNRLFSIIAHDLRGMIIPFQRVGKVVKYHLDQGNHEKAVAISSELEKNSESLSNMLDNLLNWSLEQMDGYAIRQEVISVGAELKGISDGFEQQAQYKNAKIHLLYDQELLIRFDKGAFHVIFRNLIGNGLKYTENGDIKVAFKKETGKLICTISDTGLGIPQKQLQHLFALNEVKTTIGTHGEKGTGLGLNLVYRFVKMHQGEITVLSELGKGTRFDLSFPILPLSVVAQSTAGLNVMPASSEFSQADSPAGSKEKGGLQ